jgi:cytochrome P450
VLGNALMLQHFPDHERLAYLEAVAHETLRLKAVAPLVFLEANHAVELGGIRLPAGTVVALLTRLSGLQESAFSAAQQFRPERWLTAPTRPHSGHNPSAIMPFGSGPRFCPGRSLALLEIKLIMAMLCRNFSIAKTADAKQVGEQFAFVMMPTNVFVNFRTRVTRSPA